MNDQFAAKALQELLKSGKVKQKDLVDLGLLDPLTKRLAILLHTTFCPHDHDEQCGWMKEEFVADKPTGYDPWSGKAHTRWVTFAAKFNAVTGMSHQEAIDAYRKATAIMKEADENTVTLLNLLLSRNKFWRLIETAKPEALDDLAPASESEPGAPLDQSPSALPRPKASDTKALKPAKSGPAS